MLAATADGRGLAIAIVVLMGILFIVGGPRLLRRKPKTKTCPVCAETVPAAANVCDHCEHRFD